MTHIGIVAGKELRSYFMSPVAYVVIAMFLLIVGVLTYLAAVQASTIAMQQMQVKAVIPELHVNELVFRPVFGNLAIILLLLLPMLTMRLFAEERKMRTLELLMTSPITVTEIVLGKYLAATVIFGGMVALTGVTPVMLSFFTQIDWLPLGAAYFGLFLMGSLFLSVGLFASALTENQIIAVFVSFGILLLFWMVGWAAESWQGQPIGQLLLYLSIVDHFDPFVKGLIDSRDIVYYITSIMFWIFLTHRVIESQRWR
jgi:ABC-2 type transport system permease protein